MQGEIKKLASASSVFRAYFAPVKAHWWLLAVILSGGFLAQGATLAAPLYLREFFNTIAAGNPNQALVEVLFTLLMFIVGFWLLEWVGRRIQDTANIFLSAKVMTSLITGAFSYLINHSYNFFVSNFAGSLTHRVSRFGRAFEIIFDTIVISFIPTFVFVCGAIAVLFTRHVYLGAGLLLWTVFFLLFQYWVAHLRQPARNARAEADTRVTGSLADAISNQSTVALFSGSQYEKKTFGTVVDVWRKATLRSWAADSWVWAGIGLFIIAIEAALLYGAVLLWQQGLVTVGDFVLIQAYLMTVFDRLVGMNRELRRFFDAYADAAEMVHVLELPHEIQDKKGAKTLAVREGRVVFDDVRFGFHKDLILKKFNLDISAGEKVALVGPSGAGKSTIIKLLLRLFDVKGGVITIDDQDIAKITQDSLRDAIAFVPQEPVLFHRTLMENIRYGRRDASDEEVFEAAKKAHCHEFIDKLPQKYETYVGERGIKLSGGERQRVAIARAILKNAPILVLDEATSSLDSESEAYIQDALSNLMQAKTVVVIAHRLSTIMKMDRIVVMEKGLIVATGTHLELVNQKGLYQKLWSIQAGGFLGDGAKKEDEAPIESEYAEVAEEDEK